MKMIRAATKSCVSQLIMILRCVSLFPEQMCGFHSTIGRCGVVCLTAQRSTAARNDDSDVALRCGRANTGLDWADSVRKAKRQAQTEASRAVGLDWTR